jgi:hypothetical protein
MRDAIISRKEKGQVFNQNQGNNEGVEDWLHGGAQL